MKIVSLGRLLTSNEISLEKDVKYSLTDRRITDEVITKFISLVRNDATLTTLHLKGYNTTISLPVWQSLVEAAFCHPSINDVGFHDNSLSLAHAKVFADVLEQNPQSNVTKLEFINIRILPADGFAFIFESLRKNQSIEKLVISDLTLQPTNQQSQSDGTTRLNHAVREMLQHNSSLKVMLFTHNYWGDSFATALAAGLQNNTSLTKIDYSYNSLESDGGVAFGKALRHNMFLTYLSFDYNSIGNEGAVAIAESLKSNNRSLKYLSLMFNCVTERGFIAFADAIKRNTSLESFHCGSNDNCTDLHTITCIDALKHNTTLRDVNIHQQNKTPEAQSIILNKVTELLEYNDTIGRICCSWTHTHAQKVKIKENSKSLRIAPKKAERIRRNVLTWLINNWVEHFQQSDHDRDIDPSPTLTVERKRKREENEMSELL